MAALWALQLFLEANPNDLMRGLGQDREANDTWRLTPTGCSHWRRIMGPEILTVLDYVDHIRKKPSRRTSTAMLNITIMRTLETSLPEPLTRNDAPMPWPDLHQPPTDGAMRERQERLLQQPAAGMQFVQRMFKNPDCPLWQAPDDLFRNVGFAIWDRSKLVRLGLENALEEGISVPFRWAQQWQTSTSGGVAFCARMTYGARRGGQSQRGISNGDGRG
ncbi:hypothetical protein Ct61P_06078 [Colletotrichum tofieldiae]|nr:hypothetical protein Ct61P_06078 [Colletotrichum tofieldiae]